MTQVLDHGIIEVTDVMGGDQTNEKCARVSYGGDKKARTVEETTKLLNSLIRDKHTSPFEHTVVQMYVKCPLAICVQWFRHRTWSYNAISFRYKQPSMEFYIPTEWRGQSKDNKQMSAGTVDYDGKSYQHAIDTCVAAYHDMIDQGVCREQARFVIPPSVYTEFYATVDLHNLMHFLQLRMHEHSQYEIRVYADAIGEYVAEHFPITWQAFKTHRLKETS